VDLVLVVEILYCRSGWRSNTKPSLSSESWPTSGAAHREWAPNALRSLPVLAGTPGGGSVIVGNRLLCHRNEEIQAAPERCSDSATVEPSIMSSKGETVLPRDPKRRPSRPSTRGLLPYARRDLLRQGQGHGARNGRPLPVGKSTRTYTKWGTGRGVCGRRYVPPSLSRSCCATGFVLGSPDECYEQRHPCWEASRGEFPNFPGRHWSGMPLGHALLPAMRLN